MDQTGRASSTDLPLHRFNEFATLTPAEAERIKALGEVPTRLPKGSIIRHEGVASTTIFLLLEGWASASIACLDGRHQIVKIHLPGDMMGSPSMSSINTTEALTALTPVVVSRISIKRFGETIARSPRLAVLMLLSAQRERVALMDSLSRLGQGFAKERAAAMLLDFFDRLSSIGLTDDNEFDLPLTQHQIGELLGLTPVHVNRTVRQLENEGFIKRKQRRILVTDMAGLRQLAGWTPRRWARDLDWIPQPSEDS